MSFANNYLSKHVKSPANISAKVPFDLKLCIVIPCYNEPDLISSLKSIANCSKSSFSTEVIIVINSSEIADDNVIKTNIKTFENVSAWITENNTAKLKFYIIYKDNLPSKFAGVGLARKIGMDEAIYRFNSINKKNGLIAGFDADSLCDTNYITELEKHFSKFTKINACSVYFEHPIEGSEHNKNIYSSIAKYELYLRYYNQSLRYANFPYAFHTVGSAFVVKAEVYTKQGGMNRKQAGEDFYFLQKIIPLGKFNELNTTRVIPSPRISTRVPFGTGMAIKNIIDNNKGLYVYNFEVFNELKLFFAQKNNLFKISQNEYNLFLNKQTTGISKFLILNNFWNSLIKINNNSPNINTFEKRFFQWFNAFRLIKFINFAHEHIYKKITIEKATNKLLKATKYKYNESENTKQLLCLLRNIEK